MSEIERLSDVKTILKRKKMNHARIIFLTQSVLLNEDEIVSEQFPNLQMVTLTHLLTLAKDLKRETEILKSLKSAA